HAERTAAYVAAIADGMKLDGAVRDRLAIAARLHHIGYLSLADPEDRHQTPAPETVARASGDILRETGFLSGVAEGVEATGNPDAWSAPETAELAAIVRIGCEYDHCIEDRPERAEGGLALVASHNPGPRCARAVAALRRALQTRPTLVQDAVERAEPLT